ncbi:hypothetical protein K0C01_00925 [Salinarchaeum sp. IM2453]|uniref:hypothetical protein n=1 Tax=Salinarchaeum sp. IM2453 TaxID=2862870 RepID=UPI001C82A7FD|nr:hypothetical protein [Salinarchaeum sp. IM2453]QZA88765.1 hypothetical protein K0C01_00925 [Salinarchaeum sp. IM2453]
MASSDSRQQYTIPDELKEWIDREASQRGLESDEFIRQLVAAYHESIEHEDIELVGQKELDQRIETTQGEFNELIEDVRSRVIQVKKETDKKAPKDHNHPEIEEQLSEARESVESLAATISEQQEEIDQLQSKLDQGFENYEDILEYLRDTTTEIEERVDTLGKALLDTRKQLQNVIGQHQRQEATAALKDQANEHGIAVADCEECGSAVRIGLLTEPKCPYCSSTFSEVGPPSGARRILRRGVLKTGKHPALTGEQFETLDMQIEEELEPEKTETADVSWDTVGEKDDEKL